MTRLSALALLLALAACHDSSSGRSNLAPATPEVEILGPWVGDPGLVVTLRFVARDADSAATSDVVAVPLFAGASELVLATAVPELDGAEELLDWDTSGVAEGAWTIAVRTSDGASTAEAVAGERVELGDLGTFPAVLADGLGLLQPTAHAPQAGGGALVCGTLVGDVLLAEGTPQELLVPGSFERRDLLLARYAPGGTLDWVARSLAVTARGGPITSEIAPHDLLALDGGGALAVGAFFGHVVLGNGEPGETTLFVPGDGSTQPGGMFLARWRADGALAWARQGSGVAQFGLLVSELDDGTFLVAGSARSALVPEVRLGPEGAPEIVLDGDDSVGGFLAHYGRDGALLGAQGMPLPVPGVAAQAALLALAPGTAGELYVAGWFGGSVRVVEGGEVVSAPSLNDLELYVGRVPAPSANTRGLADWVRATQSASVGFVTPLDLVALPGGGCALVGARFDTAVTFAAGLPGEVVLGPPDPAGELFLAAYAADGTLRFARDTGIVDPGASLAPFREATLVALDDGTLVLATLVDLGVLGGTFTLAPGAPDEIALVFQGEEALVLSAWSPDGELLWAVADGGTDPGFGPTLLERRPTGGLALLGRGAEALGAGTPGETPVPEFRAFFLGRYADDGSF